MIFGGVNDQYENERIELTTSKKNLHIESFRS
jgi:hypothetical protein